ncbi:MAG: DUF2786 domain-containing protein [Nostoc sp.]
MQTQVLELEKIADKIRKLFALSQSPNEAEASAAAAIRKLYAFNCVIDIL